MGYIKKIDMTPTGELHNEFTEEQLNAKPDGTPDLDNQARQIVGVEPTLDEYNVAEPLKSDYERGQDWYNTYFPTIDKGEEERREGMVRKAARWQLFGNAAASIANALGGWSGGAPVSVPEMKYPDLTAWKKELNSERRARAAQENADRKAYTTAYNTWLSGKNQYDRYNLKRKDEYQAALNKAKQALINQEWKEKMQSKAEAFKASESQKNRDAAMDRTVFGKTHTKTSGGSSSGGSRSGGTKQTKEEKFNTWYYQREKAKGRTDDQIASDLANSYTKKKAKAEYDTWNASQRSGGDSSGRSSGNSGRRTAGNRGNGGGTGGKTNAPWVK